MGELTLPLSGRQRALGGEAIKLAVACPLEGCVRKYTGKSMQDQIKDRSHAHRMKLQAVVLRGYVIHSCNDQRLSMVRGRL